MYQKGIAQMVKQFFKPSFQNTLTKVPQGHTLFSINSRVEVFVNTNVILLKNLDTFFEQYHFNAFSEP